ncbi:3998_t:CDS:2 [Funneliformis mosseae]|uniref:3998_t:CDS:1 n=1 Tax=Funneliformis mosseae TaxID=27381 RepID=A0A9N9DHK3_FUNMO|nr:3998_t:CDS:2 [Funneliformis mosseae]
MSSKECITCGQNKSSWNWCFECEHQRFRDNFFNWTSENKLIDDLIKEIQLLSRYPKEYIEWIPFSDFELIKYYGKGRHSTVYTATWLRGPLYNYDVLSDDNTRSGPQLIALKSLDNSRNITPQYCRLLKEFVRQTFEEADDNFEWCYGITQDPVYKDYMLVMSFAEEGNLYDHIKRSTIITIDWMKVIEDCFDLAKMLNGLHDRNLVHGNLHGGNVLANVEGFTITDIDSVKDRPTSEDLVKSFAEWKYALNNFDYIDDEYPEHKIITQIEEFEHVYVDTDIIREHNIHEKAVYTSQLIDFCSLRQPYQQNESPIDKLLKSKLDVF